MLKKKKRDTHLLTTVDLKRSNKNSFEKNIKDMSALFSTIVYLSLSDVMVIILFLSHRWEITQQEKFVDLYNCRNINL